MMNPTSIDMEHDSNVSFDIISGVANIRYFDAQQLAVDREEREINRELRDDCNHLRGNRVDLREREKWLEENIFIGVVE